MSLSQSACRGLLYRYFLKEGRLPTGTTGQNWDEVTVSELLFDDPPLPSDPYFRRSSAFPVRGLMAVDYVRPDSAAFSSCGLDSDAEWRARTELAWSTVVFSKYVLRANWEAHSLIDAPKAIHDADRDFNNFVQAWVKLPVTPTAGVVVKYMSRRLPPTYSNSNIATLGLSVSFYP